MRHTANGHRLQGEYVQLTMVHMRTCEHWLICERSQWMSMLVLFDLAKKPQGPLKDNRTLAKIGGKMEEDNKDEERVS